MCNRNRTHHIERVEIVAMVAKQLDCSIRSFILFLRLFFSHTNKEGKSSSKDTKGKSSICVL